jgi:hypothetical protein
MRLVAWEIKRDFTEMCDFVGGPIRWGELPIANCQLPIADCRLPIGDCRGLRLSMGGEREAVSGGVLVFQYLMLGCRQGRAVAPAAQVSEYRDLWHPE